jgi:succinate dehydrogenase / fumarate reductase membrane anchor subunit
MASNQSIKGSLEPIAWLFQIFTAIFLVFFLTVHLFLAHIYGISNVLLHVILTRLKNPWWQLFYIIFIVSLAYHGTNGLRGIIFDLNVKNKKEWNIVFWIMALVIIGYGTFLLLSIH